MRTLSLLTLVFLVGSYDARGQEIDTAAVSYVAGSTIYVDAGREQHIEIGDTLRIVRDGKEIGRAVVLATARASSAAQVLSRLVPVALGDRVIIKKVLRADRDRTSSNEADSARTLWQPQMAPPPSTENRISGRIALQLNSITAEEQRFNLNQPSVSARLAVDNLIGTGMRLTVNARAYYNAANNYSLYGNAWGLKTRAYEFSLVQDGRDGSVGYGIGRLKSRYVGSIGTFDGVEVFYRRGNLAVGILGGAQVLDRTLPFDHVGTKGSVFVSYHTASEQPNQYEGTIAYGRQMVHSNLDRQFLAVQHSLSLGADFMLYESSEFELSDIAGGVRTTSFKVSNTLLNIQYRPFDWLSAGAGYGALRTVYLFETMKQIPDSMIDRNLTQGLRASATVYLRSSAMFSADVRFGHRQGGYRDTRSLGLSARTYDMFDSEIDGGIRYATFVGPFTEESSVALDVGRSFWRDLTVTLSYEYRTVNVPALLQRYDTQIASANTYYRLSSRWGASVSGDYVYDLTMTSLRLYAELIFRF